MPAFVTMNFILCNNSFEMRCIRFNNLLKYVNKMKTSNMAFTFFNTQTASFNFKFSVKNLNLHCQ